MKGKRVKKKNKISKYIFIICLIIFIFGLSYLFYYFYNKNKDKNKIEDTKIDFPLLQNEDNNYYLTHDCKNQSNKYGSIFLKNECNINDINSNLLIYGHNMKDEEMFNCLLSYQNKEYYNQHKIIKIITENEEREYEIISAFKSRIFYENEVMKYVR